MSCAHGIDYGCCSPAATAVDVALADWDTEYGLSIERRLPYPTDPGVVTMYWLYDDGHREILGDCVVSPFGVVGGDPPSEIRDEIDTLYARYIAALRSS